MSYKQQEEISSIAKGRWPFILQSLGIHEDFLVITKHKHEGPCPICGGKTRYRFDDRTGRGDYYCNQCGAGDGFSMLMKVHGWNFNETAKNVREALGCDEKLMPPRVMPNDGISKDDPAEREKNRERLRKMWQGSKAVISGDPVSEYLFNRGLEDLQAYPSVLRYHPEVWYSPKIDDGEPESNKGKYQAMLAMFQAPDGTPLSLHRTYIKNGVKAPVMDPKKMMSGVDYLAGGAIRLFKPGKELGITEGIETAFGVHLMTGGLPVWATYSASLMKSVVIPDEVEVVHIYADHDKEDYTGAGEQNAKELRNRLLAEGRQVKLHLPKSVEKDFLDLYLEGKLKAA